MSTKTVKLPIDIKLILKYEKKSAFIAKLTNNNIWIISSNNKALKVLI